MGRAPRTAQIIDAMNDKSRSNNETPSELPTNASSSAKKKAWSSPSR